MLLASIYHFLKEQMAHDNQRKYRHLVQRRISALDHLYPHRWNWGGLMEPLDRTLERGAPVPITREVKLRLRYFWLHGLCNAISDAFYLSFIPLFALAYGATTGQIGWLTATANLLAAISLFPGARAIEWMGGKRKPIVNWSFGGIGRFAVLSLACLPLFGFDPALAIVLIIMLNGLRAFMDNFSNPAWTAIVADIVPRAMRGRYFGQRNVAMGMATLICTPVAGWLISTANHWSNLPVLGYQLAFTITFGVGMLSTLSFHRISEPEAESQTTTRHHRGDLRRAIKKSPGFLGLIISAFVWNMALQIAAPFFNVYLVNGLGATAYMVGLVTSVSSMSALVGQPIFSRLLDHRGALWVQRLTGLLIPFLPAAWMLITAPWQVAIVNIFGGMLWAGYNLANFNLLLELSPDEQRPRAVALYQTAVFSSAVLGPMLGGYLADAVSFQLIFGLSAAGRIVGMLIFLWLAARPARQNGKGLPVTQSMPA